MRPLLLLLPALLAGCISFSSTRPPGTPEYTGFCKEKELLCRDMCGGAGVQTFSCKAGPNEGLDYQCQCKKPAGAL